MLLLKNDRKEQFYQKVLKRKLRLLLQWGDFVQ